MTAKTQLVRGVSIPSFFYGTAWKEERTEALTMQAIDAGFRAIDTANQRRHYFEAAVGAAIGRALLGGRVVRDELFLQTKFTHARGQDHRLPYDPDAPIKEQVRDSFKSSLDHLHVNHVDAYLLHGPSSADGLADADWQAWDAMGALQREGKTKLIGISNVSLAQLELLWNASEFKPALVQNRCHASTGWDREVRAFCAAHGLGYQGFSLLTANKRELARPVFSRAQRRTGRTVEQIAFRFALQAGMMPMTGSSSPEHLREDLEAFDFELTADEMATIEKPA